MKRLSAIVIFLSWALMGCSEPTGQSSLEGAPDPTGVPAAPEETAAAEYIGSEFCGQCHQQAWVDWQNSHHDLALQTITPATQEAVLAHTPATLDGAGFEKSETGLRIRPRPDDEPIEARYTFGVTPLQQYVIPGGSGAWQTFPIAWDSRGASEGGQRWFNLQDETFEPGDPMHWQGRANRWNNQCADCHSTGVVKGYDPATRSYETHFEIEDVSCEACHGPGSRHALDPGAVSLAALNQQAEQINACAPCHSRRGQISEGFKPEQDFFDHYQPRLLEQGLYHVDGQINDEVFVWGSFLQSRMHLAGVSCTDCHDPHSATLKRPGNATCTFCHQSTPPEAFAGRSAGSYDTPEHHFHPTDSPGAQCVACHMPSKTYMVVDDRRDHSFRIPRPDLAAELGVPEPCTGCHTDEDAQWAATVIGAHFGEARPPHFAAAFSAADAAEPEADAALAELVHNGDQPIMVRASALSRLGGYSRGYTMDAIRLARQAEPLLRLAAPLAAASLTPDRRWRLLAPLLDDPLRAIRHQTTAVLLPTLQADPSYRTRLEPHIQAWLEDQRLNLDYPETLTNIAGAHLALGQPGAAEAYLTEALEIQANWVPGLMNLADLYRSTGRDTDARPLLEQAMTLAGDQPEVVYAYALWLSRQGQLNDGLPYFEQAARLAPSQRQYGYAFAIALNDSGNSDQAVATLEDLLSRWPTDQELLLAAITMLRDQGRFAEALPLLDRLLQQRPNDEQLIQFREAIARAAAAA